MLLYCDTVISHELELEAVYMYVVSDGPMLIALVTVDFLDSDSQDVWLVSQIQSWLVTYRVT